MTAIRKTSTLLILLIFANATPVMAGPFSQGSQSVSIIAGTGTAFRDDYLILGLGYDYFLIDGLALGIDAQFWLSGDPSITKISPQIRYVFTQPKTIKPYIGGFVRRTFISDFPDLDSYGGRAGLNFMGQGNFFFGAGIVYERYQDCNDAIVANCSDTYPELLFSFSM